MTATQITVYMFRLCGSYHGTTSANQPFEPSMNLTLRKTMITSIEN